ncbi:MAG: branched-chain amino acid transport system permease protein [Candidatus Poriferisodalaceae bacterium]|jgi:branched-chain amino acid transport system permease protein
MTSAPQIPLSYRLAGWAILAAVVLAVPTFGSSPFVTEASRVVGFAMSFIGLSVLVNQLGLLSLGQGAMTGIGAVAALHSVNDFGLPPSVMPLIGLIAGFLVGGLIAIPSLRLPGQYLALLTLSLAVAFPIVLRQIDGPLPVLLDGEFVPPGWTGIAAKDEHLWEYWIIVAWALVAILLMRRMLAGPVGRAFIACRDEPEAAASFGIAVRRTRLFGVALSGALAGFGGALLVVPTPFTDQNQYPDSLSIKMFALAMATAGTRVFGAIPAAAFLVMLPVWLDDRGWVRDTELTGLLTSEGFIYAVLLLGTAFLSRGRGGGALVQKFLVKDRSAPST